jgi:hypothetical protein
MPMKRMLPMFGGSGIGVAPALVLVLIFMMRSSWD